MSNPSYIALVEVKRDLEKQVRELTSEVACAEQRQRADMAEERERKLREVLDAADYFISRLQYMILEVPVRDMLEAEGAYNLLRREVFDVS